MTALHRHFLVVLLATWLPIGVIATAEPAKEKQPCLDRRGDPLPDGAIYRLGSTRFRAGWGVYFLAFSKDGKTLVSVNSMGRSRQDVVRIWKVDTGEQLRRFPLELTYNDSQGVALSPDGSLLAVLPEARDTLREGPIVLMDVATGRVARRFANQKHGCGIAFSPDGKLLATAEAEGTILLWDPVSGKAIDQLKGASSACRSLFFSPDGNVLASVHKDGVVRLWDKKNRRELRRFKPRVPPSEFDAAAFSPDGKILAVQWGRAGRPIEFYRTTTGERLRQSCLGYPSYGVLAFSPQGKLLAGTDIFELCLWDTTTGETIHRIEHPRHPLCLAYSPDGSLLASGNENIHLWRVATGKEIRPGGADDVEITSAAFTPDGRLLATGGSGKFLHLWDANTGEYIRRVKGHGSGGVFLGFSPDGNSLWKYREEYFVRDTAVGKQLRRIQVPPPVNGVTLSPSGSILAWESEDRAIHVRDVASGKELLSRRRSIGDDRNFELRFSPREKLLLVIDNLSCRSDILELQTGKKYPSCKEEWTFDGISPDDRVVALTDQEGRIHFQESATGKELSCTRLSDVLRSGGIVFASAFSPDGKMYAAVKESEPIRLWETATGKERLRLSGYRGWMDHLAFSPDGSKLVSVSSDRNALVWQLFGPALGRRPNDLTEPQLQNLWADLVCEDGQVAFRAVRTLTAAAPGPVVNFLRRQEKDILRLDHRRVVRWIEELDSDEFAVREKATAELEKRGVLVEDSLRMALRNRPTLEMRKRLEILLSKLADKPIAPTILRGWYAIEVLEHLPTPASRKLLEEWAKNIPEAKAAVQRSIHPLKP